MLFTVINTENENDAVIVTGSTTIGYIKGVWKAQYSPVIGKKYRIELNFPTVDISEVTVSNADAGSKIIGGKTFFTGICEDFNKVCYVRFSVEGPEMLDITDGEGTIQKSDSISFSFPFADIGIIPYD